MTLNSHNNDVYKVEVTNCEHLSAVKYSAALPHAFTEHGAIMASTVLNTQRAIEASIFVVRAFIALREMIATHKELARMLSELEQHVKDHDQQIQAIFEAIRQLMSPPEKSRKKIGFEVKESAAAYSKRSKKRKA
jgi:cytochrome c-type biogenesis protein CcmE